MALINTGAELFVFDNGAGYTGNNYVVVDNANQIIDLTEEANSAIGNIINGEWIPVSAMEIEDNTLTALSGYKIAGNTLTANYANSAYSAEYSLSSNSADYAASAKYDSVGNIIHQNYVNYDYLTTQLNKKQDTIAFNYVTTGPYSGQISGIGNSAIYAPGGGGGTVYSAGDNIDIQNGVISVTGVQLPMSAGDNIEITNSYINVTGVALTSDIPSLDGYLQGSDLSTNQFDRVSAISGKTIIAYQAQCDWSGNVITATYAKKSELPSLVGYLQGSDLELSNGGNLSSVSGHQIIATFDRNGNVITATYATKTELNNKQDTLTNAQLSAISSVSGKQNALTNAQLSAISSVSGKQNALTNAQLSAISSVSGMYNMITAMSAMLSAQWKLSAGNGIAITNNTSTKTSVISLA